jgi:hypothetical protein
VSDPQLFPVCLFPRPPLGCFQFRLLIALAHLFGFRLLIERGARGGDPLSFYVVGVSGLFEFGIRLRVACSRRLRSDS